MQFQSFCQMGVLRTENGVVKANFKLVKTEGKIQGFYYIKQIIYYFSNKNPALSRKIRRVMYYFAYGSNMDESQMRSKKVAFSSRERAILYGYSMSFSKKTSNGSGRATILPASPEDFVEGVLYEIDEKDLPRLDKPERYPVHYSRIEVNVSAEGRPLIKATTYIAATEQIQQNLKPLQGYLETLLSAKEFLSEDYYNRLANTDFIPQKIRQSISNEELYSEKLIAAGRTYFFDIKQSSKGDLYIAVSESKKTETGFERHRVMVFADHMKEFTECINSLQRKLQSIEVESQRA